MISEEAKVADPTSDEAEVLEANAAFYRAFAGGDFDSMMELWSPADTISCVHPGWPPVRGVVDVMAAWKGILSSPPSPPIRALEPRATIYGGLGCVVCFESIGEIYLVATNLFHREGGAWKMVHHQAGPTERIPRSVVEPASGQVLH